MIDPNVESSPIDEDDEDDVLILDYIWDKVASEDGE